MNNQFQIRVHSGSLRGQAFVINKQEFRVGRDTSCDIILSENAVSRVHLLIYPQAYNSIVLVDNNSTNGTTVNNVPVTAPVQITENDVIMLGGEVALVLEKVPVMPQPYPGFRPEEYAQPPQQIPQYQPPIQPAPAEMNQFSNEFRGHADSHYAQQSGNLPGDAVQANGEGIPNINGDNNKMKDAQNEYSQPSHAAEANGYSADSLHYQAPFPASDQYSQQPEVPGMPGGGQFPPQQYPPYSQYPGQQPSYGYPPAPQPFSQQGQYGQPPQPISDPHSVSGYGQAPSQYSQSIPWGNQPPYNQQMNPYAQNPIYGQNPGMQPNYPYGNQANQPYYGTQPGMGNYPVGEYDDTVADDEQAKKKKLFIILGIVLLLIIAIVIFIIYIDSNYLWCDVFPFLWSPEACAIYP